jgi:serine/threonine protein kinase
LGEEIGKGAYSTVFKALNIETGNFFAIKRIKRKKVTEDALKVREPQPKKIEQKINSPCPLD